MRNVWKGLAVGAFAGAAVGVVLDAFESTRRGAVRASAKAKAGARHLVDVIEDKIDEE